MNAIANHQAQAVSQSKLPAHKYMLETYDRYIGATTQARSQPPKQKNKHYIYKQNGHTSQIQSKQVEKQTTGIYIITIYNCIIQLLLVCI
jgi:hypothetical protein